MHSSRKTLMRGVLLAAVTAAWLALPGTSSAQALLGAPPAAKAAQPAADYAGQDACLTCHEDRAAYTGTPHGRVWNSRTPAAAQGCETCHGPGQAHVDSGGDKAKIKRFSYMQAADVSETCLTCHARGDRVLWEGSQHDGRDLSCVSCHSVHAPRSEESQLKNVAVTETCAQCHRDKAQRLQRSAHMPVREGKMECTSCHNPHGSANVRLLRTGTSVNESCVSCHSEKRGPFLWEHAAVEESCVTCHDPHGSSNDRLLVARAPFLCQRCHVTARHPPTVYDAYALSTGSNRVTGRSCVNCHQQLHGSNSPSGQMFLR